MDYFFDTSIIIDILNKDESTLEKIKSILSHEDSKIFINRLVYIETLRTVPYKNTKIFKQAKQTLESFEKVDITQSIYDDTIAFSRFCKSKGINLKGKCEAIDFLHFITAKHYELEMISNDGDFKKLDEAYRTFKNE